MLRIFVDDLTAPLLALPIDLQHTLGLDDGRAWTGFTGATGRRFQNQYVLAWQFCEGAAGCSEPLSACDAFGCNPEFPSARYDNSAEGGDPAYAELATGVPARTNAPRGAGTTSHSPGQDGGDGASRLPDDDEIAASEAFGSEPAGFQARVAQPRTAPRVLRNGSSSMMCATPAAQVLTWEIAEPQDVIAQRFG